MRRMRWAAGLKVNVVSKPVHLDSFCVANQSINQSNWWLLASMAETLDFGLLIAVPIPGHSLTVKTSHMLNSF